jgi:hypothetical protein
MTSTSRPSNSSSASDDGDKLAGHKSGLAVCNAWPADSAKPGDCSDNGGDENKFGDGEFGDCRRGLGEHVDDSEDSAGLRRSDGRLRLTRQNPPAQYRSHQVQGTGEAERKEGQEGGHERGLAASAARSEGGLMINDSRSRGRMKLGDRTGGDGGDKDKFEDSCDVVDSGEVEYCEGGLGGCRDRACGGGTGRNNELDWAAAGGKFRVGCWLMLLLSWLRERFHVYPDCFPKARERSWKRNAVRGRRHLGPSQAHSEGRTPSFLTKIRPNSPDAKGSYGFLCCV